MEVISSNDRLYEHKITSPVSLKVFLHCVHS